MDIHVADKAFELVAKKLRDNPSRLRHMLAGKLIDNVSELKAGERGMFLYLIKVIPLEELGWLRTLGNKVLKVESGRTNWTTLLGILPERGILTTRHIVKMAHVAQPIDLRCDRQALFRWLNLLLILLAHRPRPPADFILDLLQHLGVDLRDEEVPRDGDVPHPLHLLAQVWHPTEDAIIRLGDLLAIELLHCLDRDLDMGVGEAGEELLASKVCIAAEGGRALHGLHCLLEVLRVEISNEAMDFIDDWIEPLRWNLITVDKGLCEADGVCG